jgi:tRNA A37 threonylcarbamoyladenosine dehydratase
MDMIYDRQKELGINIPSSILMVGCGGLGYFVTSALNAAGVEKFTLIDGDRIEITNLNRTFYPMGSIGDNKAEALKRMLLAMRPDNRVLTVTSMATVDMIDFVYYQKGAVIVDCTDDYEFQKAMCKMSKEKGWRYVRVGCNVNHITVTSSVPDWTVGKPERVQCGVHIAAWVVPVMKASQYAVDKILRRPDLEISEEV